jgi:two-component system phosphate regulon sensor histidine kinase PhoR
MTLIEDLLDLSSLESNEALVLTKTPVNTKDITYRVITQLEPRRLMKNLTIDARYDSEIVHCDPRRLEQVLVNLIDNAMKYGPQGGRVQLVWEKAAHAVLLRVIDNGPGIPREYQPRLFERFFRIDKARSREMGGTGLGLAIVKHIMQRHGGSVQVKSDIGQGTEFICEFPET